MTRAITQGRRWALACVIETILVAGGLLGSAHAGGPLRLRVAIHVHSTVSTGALSPPQIVSLATQTGLDGVIFTDSALRRWEYGVWPLRGVVKRVVEQPSVFTFGVARYLDAIQDLNTTPSGSAGIISLAGLEVAPFYYWHRSPFDRRGGEIRGWNQHLLVFGLDDARTIERLPLGARDPYHGNRGAHPYQQLIDEVVKGRGLVFWAHPETPHVGSHGSVEDYTEPYPHLLERTTNYHGFAITYLGHLSLVEPGGLWDRLLNDYCRGQRSHPVWVIGEADWRKPEERPLDFVVTELLADDRSPAAALQALREGRMWAVLRRGAQAPQLSTFTVTDLATQRTATVGGRVALTGAVEVRVTGRLDADVDGSARIILIKDGQVFDVRHVAEREFDLRCTDGPHMQAGFYRVVIESRPGVVYTNPIFVQWTD